VEPPPQFSAHFYCGQTAGCIKMPLGMEVGLSPSDFVLDGDAALLDGDAAPTPQKGGGTPNFRPVYCGQTAAWIKMPLGTEVGLGSDDIVLDIRTQLPSPKRGRSPLPNFRPISIMAKRLDASR